MEICFEEEYIYSLPERNIIYNKQQISARIDVQNGIAYTLDSNKKWNRQYIRLPSTAEEPAAISTDEAEPSEPIPCAAEEDDATTTEDSPKKRDLPNVTGFLNTKNGKAVLAAAAVLALILAGNFIGGITDKMAQIKAGQTISSDQTETSVPPSEQTQPSQTETTQVTEIAETTVPMVQLAVCGSDLLPGTKIQEKLFTAEAIAEKDYRAMTAANGIYTWEDFSKISGMYVTEYLPAGSYLSYNVVSSRYAPTNPWENSEKASFDLRIADTSGIEIYNIGNSLTLKVSESTTLSDPALAVTEYPAGISAEQTVDGSTVILTYTLTNIRVADFLNDKSSSLFSTYFSYSKIPAAYRYDAIMSRYNDDKLLKWDEYPETVRLQMTQEQADILNDLPSSGRIVIAGSTPTLETPLQEDTYEALASTLATLKDIWAVLIGG